MYSYVYSVNAVEPTLTSTGVLSSTYLNLSLVTVISGTNSYTDVTTFTTSSVQTYTSGQTYTITDYTSGTTETCDYSATTSRQTLSSLDSNTSGSTYSYKTITHSTNGSHTVSESTVIATLFSSSETSFTNPCAFTYFATDSFTASTVYGGTRTKYTGSSIFHTPYGTHTVSSSTQEIVKAYDNATSFTQSCDYSKPSSLQTTSGSSDFGGYSQSTYISTEHGQYGVHSIISRTVEVASSNASQTRSYIYFSENTSGSSYSFPESTIGTNQYYDKQTGVNSENRTGSISVGTNSVGYTSQSFLSTGSTHGTTIGYQDGLTGVTDGNSIFFFKQISDVTIDIYYSTNYYTDVSVFFEYSTAYYQPEVWKSYSATTFYSSTIAKIYRTGADVVSGKKSYTTESYINSYSTFTSGETSSQNTTSYGSTRQTSSLSNNTASISSTKASTIFEARFTSRTVTLTQTITTQSSSGSSTITSTRTYSGFSTTGTTITQTQGTIATSYGTLTVTNNINWFTAYVRDNGELLLVMTNTSLSEAALSNAGLITTSWANESAIKETKTTQSNASGIYYTYGVSSTWTTTKWYNSGSLSSNAFSVSPWVSSNYNSIENAYGFSLIGSSSSSYNPDISVFSMSEYAETASTTTQSFTLNRGIYLVTYNSLNGATSSYTTSVTYLTSTETGYQRKIKPMSFVTFIPALVLPRVTHFTTSNIVLKI